MLQLFLAEDNLGDVLLVREALRRSAIGHELIVVRDGAEALRFIAQIGTGAQQKCPDLFLLDLNLPKVRGPEVLVEFRQREECTSIPVIVVSSSDAENDRMRMHEIGISHYFRKPYELEAFMELGAVVRRILNLDKQ